MPGNQSTKQTSLRTVDRAKEFSHIIAILHKWGVHTLGDLAALPPDQLGARLGPAAVLLWEQATGRATRLLRLVRPTEVFAEEIEFDYEIETAEPLLFVLHRFLEQLTLRLGALYLVAREMTASQAEEYYGLFFARQALYLDPGYLPAQVIFLSLALDKGFDQPLLHTVHGVGFQMCLKAVEA